MTTTTKPKADYSSDQFFTVASAVDILAQVAEDHCPKAFQDVSLLLDMSPSSLMRGAAYLGWLLAQVPDDERNPDAELSAQCALAETTSLAAVLIEIQNRAGMQELIRELSRRA